MRTGHTKESHRYIQDPDRFQFLADRICQTQTTCTILVTNERRVRHLQNSFEAVSPCLHEEADTPAMQ